MIFLTKIYSKIYELVHDLFGVNLRGLGWLLRRCKSYSLIVMPNNKNLFFDHKIAESYPVLIGGGWAEKETHLYLNKIIDNKTVFIDVGANVGEMVLDFSDKAKKTFAFEPSKKCFNVLEVNKLVNSIDNLYIYNFAISDECSDVYIYNDGTPQASISNNFIEGSNKIKQITLDSFFDNSRLEIEDKVVILIDVEGHELNVLKGAIDTINNYKPTIVFEFNEISRKYFTLEDISQLIGSQYEIFRLNKLGNLDKEFDKTWNCVAVPK